MIWQILFWWVAQANEWAWQSLEGLVNPAIAGASYTVVGSIRTVAAKVSGLGFVPWQTMVQWVALVFSTFGAVVVLGIIRLVLRVLLGARNPAE